jgi:aryl-alcohol dehydrogenase-like predicted oxidoreductase
MARLKEEGKIRHIGICEAGPETVRRAAAVHPVTAIQSEYNLMTRDYEDATIPAVKELGIGFVAYYPLARGFFAGAITRPPMDGRKSVPRFSAENLTKNLVLLTRLRMMAEARGCTEGQLALAWLLHKGDFIVPIPGTNSVAHLEENCAAADVTLSASEMAKIDRIFARGVVKGARFDRDRSNELNI